MTVSEALLAMVVFPVPTTTVEKFCIERGLLSNVEYSPEVASSQNFKLAEADLYHWMATSPDIKEQELSLNPADRKYYLNKANKVYGEFDDSKNTSFIYGFVGENFN